MLTSPAFLRMRFVDAWLCNNIMIRAYGLSSEGEAILCKILDGKSCRIFSRWVCVIRRSGDLEFYESAHVYHAVSCAKFDKRTKSSFSGKSSFLTWSHRTGGRHSKRTLLAMRNKWICEYFRHYASGNENPLGSSEDYYHTVLKIQSLSWISSNFAK